MPAIPGYGAKMGVVVPSAITTMETELYAMAPNGAAFHIARLCLAHTAIGSAEQTPAAVHALQAALQVAVRDVLTIEPDRLVIGVPALSFMGGVAGHARFQEDLAQSTALPITPLSRQRLRRFNATRPDGLVCCLPIPKAGCTPYAILWALRLGGRNRRRSCPTKSCVCSPRRWARSGRTPRPWGTWSPRAGSRSRRPSGRLLASR
jgi:hypothetical protein